MSSVPLVEAVARATEQAWRDYHGNALLWNDVAEAAVRVVLQAAETAIAETRRDYDGWADMATARGDQEASRAYHHRSAGLGEALAVVRRLGEPTDV